MKNTTILLIFLLSILGLIIGVHYTEDTSDDINQYTGEEIHIESDNPTIIINLEKQEKEDSFLDKLFT